MYSAKLREIFWKPIEDAVATPRPLVSGSGLIKADDGLWAVGDDLHHLIHIPMTDEVSVGHRLFPGDLPLEYRQRKKKKPDTEAFFEVTRRGRGAVWLAMPSGSEPNRVKGAVIRKGQGLDIRERDFSPLFKVLGTQIQNINIEGATLFGDKLVLFQRGNGPAGENAIITVALQDFIVGFRAGEIEPSVFQTNFVDLGEWDGARITFTDGFAWRHQLIFSAAAEQTDSAFEDGKIIGSVIGIWDGKYARIVGRVPKVKIEGLALDRAAETEMTCFAITDSDEAASPSCLLRLIFGTI